MRSFFAVFKFEYSNYIKSKSFIVITAIMLILAIALPCVPTIMGLITKPSQEDSKNDVKTAAIIDNTGMYSIQNIAGGFSNYSMVDSSRELAMESLSNGELAFVMEITGEAEFKLYVSKMNISQFDLMSMTKNAFEKEISKNFLTSIGLTENDVAQLRSINATAQIITVSDSDQEQGQNGMAYVQKLIYAYILVFVLYFTLILYGQYIVTAVVSEKSSKAMELLVTSTKPLNLIFGKVLGVGAAGLTQFAFMLTGAFVSFFINSKLWPDLLFGSLGISSISELGSTDIGGDFNAIIAAIMTPASPTTFIYLIVFFILGFFIYAFLYAAFASTASRIEEANTVQAVPMMFILSSFLIAMLGLANPGGTLTVVCSYIPFMTPMVMFMRICTDSVSSTGALIATIVLALSVFIVGFMSAKIYRVGILLYGKPPKLIEILKMLVKAKV